MKPTPHLYIACDLGAESGRVLVGTIKEKMLAVEEVHRFPTGAVRHESSWRWDGASLENHLLTGLACAAKRQGPGQQASVSVDSWGVDYVLMRQGLPLSLWPHHYRDERTQMEFSAVQSRREMIFAETGLQFLAFNTLYQLLAERAQNPHLWEEAQQFLLIADYFLFRWSGVAVAEHSLASTTQLFDPRSRTWSVRLQREFKLPSSFFPSLVEPGTKLGEMLPAIQSQTGLKAVSVIATCSHDTGAAVAAVPATDGDWAFLSSGTWSLLGTELNAPLLGSEVRRKGFTNEVGWGGTIRFLKNIVGLWIVQECRRSWENEGVSWDYQTLNDQAATSQPFRSLIRPDDAQFAMPGEMPDKIATFCRESGQHVPRTAGEFMRCILESLALLYRETLHDLELLTGKTMRRLHIVGGGSQSALLNQFTANATQRPVWAGPVEATALGNIVGQAVALGHLDSLAHGRELIASSFSPHIYQPQESNSWHTAAAHFSQLHEYASH